MIPSRYILVGERSPRVVKRRGRGQREEKGRESAITLLPPDPYLIMEKPNFSRSSSPTVYRTVPPKSAKDKEASSFVILGETMSTPVQSRPGSPSGRVSPFRGHGFKSPTTTRPNSRAPSPSGSPKINKSVKSIKGSERPKVGRDVGLPPKSPMKSKSQKSKVKPAASTATTENSKIMEVKMDSDKQPILENKELGITEESQATTPAVIKESLPKGDESSQMKAEKSKPTRSINTNQTPNVAVLKDRKHTVPLPLKPKANTEKNESNNEESVKKKAAKPPLPPKKIGLKTTLKNENSNEQSKTNSKSGIQEQNGFKESAKTKENLSEVAKTSEYLKKTVKDFNEKEKHENCNEAENPNVKEKEEAKAVAKVEDTKIIDREPEESNKVEKNEEEKDGNGKKNTEKLVPCFQPDKCQIAPPTMASPSPIITPTISTPSTTADLASSSMKNSQSIAAAPTTVTPSSLGSVSSTVVLTGNLARKEIENRNRSKITVSSEVHAKDTKDTSPHEKVSDQMVKAASKDSIKWSNKDNLSGEITSSTKLIKAEPDVEVLSPNNLRDSPPRIPPPNMAWDEGRLPNGDVSNKAEKKGKFRSLISALLRFFGYLFCCRCLDACKCCQRATRDGMAKPSIFSKLSCCDGKSCDRNPFKCCSGSCQSKCCGGKKCCRKNQKPKNPDRRSRTCCAKANCSCKGCCDKMKTLCLDARYKINSFCRSLFCLNMRCCQKFLRKFKCCHKFKCCQKNGFCSCCNPNVKKEPRKLNKKGSHSSNNSGGKDNLDVVLVEHTSLMKAAIPVLPSCLAVFCLILNLFVPGIGTFISGIFCLCFGKPRFSIKDTPKNRLGSFILNTIIGVAQLFTVVFCLVGWGWSIWWGVIMYKLSRRQKRLKLAEKNQQAVEGSNVNHNHVDVEQG